MGYSQKDEAKMKELDEISFGKSSRHVSSQNDLDSARAYNHPGCSSELTDIDVSCPPEYARSGNATQVDQKELMDEVKKKYEQLKVPVIHPATIIDAENKLQKLYSQFYPGADRDEHRIKEIIMQLTRKGVHIINERPEGMNMSDYRRVRQEFARLKKTYTSGKIIHKSKSVEYQRDHSGKVIKTESEGTTYHKK